MKSIIVYFSRSGENIDKLLGSYEKIIKVGEFTPKNIKNA